MVGVGDKETGKLATDYEGLYSGDNEAKTVTRGRNMEDIMNCNQWSDATAAPESRIDRVSIDDVMAVLFLKDAFLLLDPASPATRPAGDLGHFIILPAFSRPSEAL